MTHVALLAVAERRVLAAAMARHKLEPEAERVRTRPARGETLGRDQLLLDWRRANDALTDACEALSLLRARTCPTCDGHGHADAWGPTPPGWGDGECPAGCDNGTVRP